LHRRRARRPPAMPPAPASRAGRSHSAARRGASCGRGGGASGGQWRAGSRLGQTSVGCCSAASVAAASAARAPAQRVVRGSGSGVGLRRAVARRRHVRRRVRQGARKSVRHKQRVADHRLAHLRATGWPSGARCGRARRAVGAAAAHLTRHRRVCGSLANNILQQCQQPVSRRLIRCGAASRRRARVSGRERRRGGRGQQQRRALRLVPRACAQSPLAPKRRPAAPASRTPPGGARRVDAPQELQTLARAPGRPASVTLSRRPASVTLSSPSAGVSPGSASILRQGARFRARRNAPPRRAAGLQIICYRRRSRPESGP
jgi:hypothetical protein